MKLDDFYIQKKLDQHNKQIRRRILSALLILTIGGLTLWLI
jgi:hypothetical protein